VTGRSALSIQQALMAAAGACEHGRFDEAEARCAAILKAHPTHFGAWYLLAAAQSGRGDATAALASCDRALAVNPRHAETLHLRGAALQQLGQFAEALASYDAAVALRPDYPQTQYNRAVVLHELRRHGDALAGFDRALALRPDHGATHNNRGNTLHALGRFDEALASYDRALALEPGRAGTFANRGHALQALGRFNEARVSFERALALDPSHPHALSGLAECALKSCDFARRNELEAALRQAVTQDSAIVFPFVLLGYADDATLQSRAARQFIKSRIPAAPPPLWRGEVWRNERIKLAYVSVDFRAHALANLITEVLELHDRTRFEVIGISLGPDDGSPMRARFVKAFDRFVDVRAIPDHDVAAMLHNMRTEIVIDLNGYTMGCRPEILAWRPAPIAVNYLGYPGTMGIDFVDYIIADATVLPFDRQSLYAEQIIHLPDSYQPNDSKRAIAAPAPSRQACGLPERGFVFCCFNRAWKIAPAVFEVWMRLLQKVEGSVLWLLHDGDEAAENLRREAAARGVDPARLLFAPKLPGDDHLARHTHADLFLDTLPYHAHTTASDALWCGVPVVTCCGQSFAARVAASLLQAAGLADLVTSNLEEYETLALELAADPSLLDPLKARVARNRSKCSLFDSVRYCQQLETAYVAIWERWYARGEERPSYHKPEGRTDVFPKAT
jgi:predicted O-linked N-acetylglucosamine transferase (SPINDLY family)